ncbi:MAG: histidine kinase N-terminal 7TM domain-containing protein [Patescibacteria group bacterium]
MQIQGTILLVIAGIELILGLYLFFRHPKNHITISYFLFILGVVIWVISNGLAIFRGGSDIVWWKMTYVGGALLASSFVYFAMVFPYSKKQISKCLISCLYLPAIYFTIVLFSTNILVERLIKKENQISNVTLGPLYHLYVLFVVIFCLWGLYYLFTKFKTSDGIHRWQLKYLLWGIVISSVVAVTSDLVMPFFSENYLINYPWVGSGFSIVWLFFTSYVVFKKVN